MAPALGPELNPLPTIMGSLVAILVGNVLLYVYFGVTLMVIARKTNTRNAWLAWIPIGNIFLMCSAGRRPAWWVLLLLIPVVNLVVVAILWMSIAEVRGKAPWTGVLVLVPVVGLLVPAYLAAGRATTPDLAARPSVCPHCGTEAEEGDEFCGSCGEAVLASAAPRVPACSQCGAEVATGDEFCGACGAVLPRAARVPPPKPVWQLALAGTGMVVTIAALGGGLSWLTVARVGSYTPPEREAPALPKRMAGTMTEFPVDTDPVAPARPDSVVSKDFGGAEASAAETEVPGEWLPPGIEPESLPDRATAATCATYRPTPSRTAPSAGAAPDKPDTGEGAAVAEGTGEPDDWVCVTVLETPAGSTDEGREIATDVAAATGGERTRVRVKSPDGDVYSGTRIESPEVLVIVLDKQAADVVVIVYAPHPEMAPVAERLAANVGNGEGLYDYPEARGSIWTLPAEPPAGFVLQEVTCLTPYDLGLSAADVDAAIAEAEDAQVRRLLSRIRNLIPQRFVFARYADESSRDWQALICEYGSPRRAWLTWTFVRYALGASGMRPTPVLGVEGLYLDGEGGSIVLCQKGPYLAVLAGPADGTAERLTQLADALQM